MGASAHLFCVCPTKVQTIRESFDLGRISVVWIPKFRLSKWPWLFAAAFLVVQMIVGFIEWRQYLTEIQAQRSAVMSGEVRKDSGSGVLYVPSCESYSLVSSERIREFETVSVAERAGFEYASRCLGSDPSTCDQASQKLPSDRYLPSRRCRS